MALDPGRTVRELQELRALTGDENGAQRVCWTDTWLAARAWLRERIEDVLFARRADATERLIEFAAGVKGGARAAREDDAWRRGTVMDPAAPSMPGGTDPGVLAGAMPDVAPVAPQPIPAATEPVAAEATPARAYTTAAKGFWVQLAALARRDGVERLQQRIAFDLQPLQPLLAVFQEASLFKLQLGPYGSREQAHAAARHAQSVLQVRPVVIERR